MSQPLRTGIHLHLIDYGAYCHADYYRITNIAFLICGKRSYQMPAEPIDATLVFPTKLSESIQKSYLNMEVIAVPANCLTWFGKEPSA